MDPADAYLAVQSGADAMIVSNHGGRQLDGAPATIEALPAIVDAVGSDIDVWLDGGIRTGQDISRRWPWEPRDDDWSALYLWTRCYGRSGCD